MWIVAKNTFKEFIRNKLFYLLIGISFLFLFLSIVVVNLSLTEGGKVLLDFNLSFIEFFGLISTLFLASYLIYNEVSKNTILIILSKNPSRKDFILGKYLGFSLVLALIYIILSITFFVVWLGANYFYELNFNISWTYILLAIFFSYIKMLVVLAFIIFFSTFLSPFVSLLVTLGIYIISHMTGFVKFYVAWKTKGEGIVNYFTSILYYIFPNFQDLSVKEYLLSPAVGNYNLSHIILSLFANLFYIAILLILAIYLFKKKEF